MVAVAVSISKKIRYRHFFETRQIEGNETAMYIYIVDDLIYLFCIRIQMNQIVEYRKK